MSKLSLKRGDTVKQVIDSTNANFTELYEIADETQGNIETINTNVNAIVNGPTVVKSAQTANSATNADLALSAENVKVGTINSNNTNYDIAFVTHNNIPGKDFYDSGVWVNVNLKYNPSTGVLSAPTISAEALTEGGKSLTEKYATPSQVDTKIDTAVKGLLGEGVSEAYDTFKEIQLLMEADDTETADLIAQVNANATNISNLTSSVQTQLDEKLGKNENAVSATKADSVKTALKQDNTNYPLALLNSGTHTTSDHYSGVWVQSGLTYNPSTGVLSATSIVEGGTALASKYLGKNENAVSATVASTVSAGYINTNNIDYPIAFITKNNIPNTSTYNSGVWVNSNLTYNPSSGVLSATSFVEGGISLSGKYATKGEVADAIAKAKVYTKTIKLNSTSSSYTETGHAGYIPIAVYNSNYQQIVVDITSSANLSSFTITSDQPLGTFYVVLNYVGDSL